MKARLLKKIRKDFDIYVGEIGIIVFKKNTLNLITRCYVKYDPSDFELPQRNLREFIVEHYNLYKPNRFTKKPKMIPVSKELRQLQRTAFKL